MYLLLIFIKFFFGKPWLPFLSDRRYLQRVRFLSSAVQKHRARFCSNFCELRRAHDTQAATALLEFFAAWRQTTAGSVSDVVARHHCAAEGGRESDAGGSKLGRTGFRN